MFKNTLLLLFSLVIVLSVGEVAIRYTQYDAQARTEGTANKWKSYNNIFVKSFEPGSDCSFPDRVVAHPYLGFVNQSFTPCSYNDINNKGFEDHFDIPPQRDPNYFSILLTGGSVAQQMAMGQRSKRKIWLEEYLNRDFKSPNGKPFRILQGAMGAWRTPVQNSVITLYGDVVDAVIALDGWNEALNTSANTAIDSPDYLYFQLINTKLSLGKTIGLDFLRRWRVFSANTPVVQNSFLSFFIFEKMMGLVVTHDAMALEQEAVFKYFNLPADWKPEQVSNWNKEKFKTYQKLNSAAARALNIHYAHFLQPIRLIGKTLTEDEKFSDFVTKESYEKVFIAGTEELAKADYPAYSLVDVFQDHPESIYGDFIHCKFENNDSRGYSIMSLRISQVLKKAWNLTPINSAQYGQLL